MELKKIALLLRQINTQLLPLLVGVLPTIGINQILPSQANPVPTTSRETPNLLAQRQPITDSPHSFVTAAVKRVGPAVVRINTERSITRSIHPLLENSFAKEFFPEQDLAQIPQERRLRGQGSGFIIDKSGIILTNAHVVDRADKVTVILKDGRQFNGKVQGVDEVTDLAVVKIDGQNLPVAPLGDSSQIEVGDWAIAVGNPLGLDNTVTLGIISTLQRSSTAAGIPDKRIDFIQTDAAINPGNSGGPLLNARGEVIGINTAIRVDAMGIGFAIPINKAKEISSKLARGEKVTHAYIGIRMTTLTPEIARENNSDSNSSLSLPEVNGVLVIQVLPDSPAQTGGLRKGDVITQIDGKSVTTADQLQRIVEDSSIDRVLQLQVQRDGQTKTISVRTGELQE